MAKEPVVMPGVVSSPFQRLHACGVGDQRVSYVAKNGFEGSEKIF